MLEAYNELVKLYEQKSKQELLPEKQVEQKRITETVAVADSLKKEGLFAGINLEELYEIEKSAHSLVVLINAQHQQKEEFDLKMQTERDELKTKMQTDEEAFNQKMLSDEEAFNQKMLNQQEAFETEMKTKKDKLKTEITDTSENWTKEQKKHV